MKLEICTHRRKTENDANVFWGTHSPDLSITCQLWGIFDFDWRAQEAAKIPSFHLSGINLVGSDTWTQARLQHSIKSHCPTGSSRCQRYCGKIQLVFKL